MMFIFIDNMSKTQQPTHHKDRQYLYTKAMKVFRKHIFNSAQNFPVGELIFKFKNIVD